MDEDATTRLLGMASPRPAVPTDRTERVRRAVRLEWQAGASRRAARRRAILIASILAAAAAVIFAFRLSAPRDMATPVAAVTVATVERVDGRINLSANDSVRTGDWVETGATGRAALRLRDGTSARLDKESRARLISPRVIELSSGAVYVDTGSSSSGIEVRTPFGIAHDIGTQFEVRLRGASLEIRVRTGTVELRHAGGSIAAAAGTEVILASGQPTSRAVERTAGEWAWAAGIAAPFPIEGRPLAAFLDHVSREQGWTLRYADASLADRAHGIVLHGSIEGLQPRDQLTVTLASSGLAYRLEGGHLTVFRR